jgi:hypothetical protein
MLKVSIHACEPGDASQNNLLGRLDIAYAKLGAIADYKAIMLATGFGVLAPARLEKYPRWSAGLWDLVARVICVCINRREDLGPAPVTARRGAYITNLVAIVEHWPDGQEMRRSRVAEAHVRMLGKRCNYEATFEDDITGTVTSGIFRHTPAVITAWDLLARAFAWTVTESFVLPPRPALYTPIPFEEAGDSYVCLETVNEPARTGCLRWLEKRAIALIECAGLKDCVLESQYVEFLERGV